MLRKMAEHEGRTLRIEIHWEEVILRLPLIYPVIKDFYRVVKDWLKSKRLATLHGHVVDERTGTPIEGILVTCEGSMGCHTAKTAGDGSYHIKDLPPGNLYSDIHRPTTKIQTKGHLVILGC